MWAELSHPRCLLPLFPSVSAPRATPSDSAQAGEGAGCADRGDGGNAGRRRVQGLHAPGLAGQPASAGSPSRTRTGDPGCIADSSCPRRRFHRPRLWQFSPVSGLCVSSGLTSRRVGHAGKAGAGGDFLGPLRPKGPCRSLCPLRVGPGAPDATVGTRCLGRWARWPPAKARVTGCLPPSAGGHRKPRPVPSARTEAPTKLL